MSDNDLPIRMLGMHAYFAKDAKSELFGFWYFKGKCLPSTIDGKRAFFHDLITGQSCQLSLHGSLDQIWELVSCTAQGQSLLPPYARLQESLTQHSPIRVTFDDLAVAEGTSLVMSFSTRLTEPLESVVSKLNSRRDVVELEIEPEWKLGKVGEECLL